MGKVADFFREQSITLDGQKKTKMLSLDRQFEKMETERDRLKTENLNLKAQVNPLQREIDRLKQQIEQEKARDHGQLDDGSEKVLVAVANTGRSREQIIEDLGLTKAKGEYHFDILVDRKFVIEGSYVQGHFYFEATPEGRSYLASRDLL